MTRILVLLVACASCIETALQPCGDGLLCPANTICVAEQSLCVSQEQLDACRDQLDGSSCNAGNGVGECTGGVCLTPVCGDRFVEPGEACDDGNQTSGDGCNAVCTSTEICGNGVVDIAEGEACDDGGRMSADGCDSNCRPESETWRLEGINPKYLGPGRMAYDATRHQLLSITDSILWTWDGARWSIVSTTGLPVDDWGWQQLVYAPDRGTVILLGYRPNELAPCRVWEWNGTTWTEIVAIGRPSFFGDPRAAYDTVRHTVLLVGNSLGFELWELDPAAQRWTQRPAPGATASLSYGFAFDEARGHAVFGQANGSAATVREWTGSAWTSPIASVLPQDKWTLAYDPSVSAVVAVSDSVARWTGTTWTVSAGPPAQRTLPDAAYDRDRNRLVVFGNEGVIRDELYEREGAQWSARHSYPVETVDARYAYDTERRRLLQFGPGDQAGVRTFALSDDGAWTELPRAPTNVLFPSPVAIAYDPIRRAAVVQAVTRGTFVLGDAGWETLEPFGTSAPDGIFATAFDPVRRGIIGLGDDRTWFLPSEGTAWIELGPPQPMALPATVAVDARSGDVFMTSTFGPARRLDATGWTTIVSPGPGHFVVGDARRGTVVILSAIGVTYERVADAWRERPALPFAVTGPGFYRPHSGELVLIGTIAEHSHVLLVRTFTNQTPLDACAGGDEDNDTLIDCADPDCWWACQPACPPFTSCP